MIVFARSLSVLFLALLMWAVWRAARLCRTERRTARTGTEAVVSPPDAVEERAIVSVRRWLDGLRALFVVSGIVVLMAHGYWSFFVSGPLLQSESYARYKRLYDQRHRRLEEIGLRGWIFDRRKQELDDSSSQQRQSSAAERRRIEESLLAGYRLEATAFCCHLFQP